MRIAAVLIARILFSAKERKRKEEKKREFQQSFILGDILQKVQA